MDISSLKIAIDSRDALTAKSNLDNLNRSAGNTSKGVTSLSSSFLNFRNIWELLETYLTSILYTK